MWLFRQKKTLAESGFFRGFTDCHSHLLPGIDDGVKTEEETWRILDEMERQGVRKIWLTPHVMEDMSNKTVTLQQKFLSLKQKYQGKVELALAAEYMLKTLSVSGNFLFQSTNGITVYFATHPKERLSSFVGPSGTI